MKIDPNTLKKTEIYKLMTGIIVPRPVAWVSTISKDGINNLAPYSYFNAVGSDPPHVVFCPDNPDFEWKDTMINIMDTGEFAINMVSEDLFDPMLTTASAFDIGVDEFEQAGVTPEEATKIHPKLVAESPISLECKLVHVYETKGSKEGSGSVIIGEVVMFHVRASLLRSDFKMDFAKYAAIGRLAGRYYINTRNKSDQF